MEDWSPFYNPPYDSPIEDILAYHIVKYLDQRVSFIPQVEVKTICGIFRVDFMVYGVNGEKIGFECDGKEFHEEGHDEWRDAMILGADKADTMYRLRGSDITYHINDVLYALSQWSPTIFSQRGYINLGLLASDKARTHVFKPTDEHGFIAEKVWIWRSHKYIHGD